MSTTFNNFDRPIDADRHEAVRRLDALAWLLDSALRVPGTRLRFGLDGVLGLVPGAGDLVTAALSLYLVAEAWRLGLPKRAIIAMLGNIGVDTAIGAVPLLGDIFDFAFKANRRNMSILHRHLG